MPSNRKRRIRQLMAESSMSYQAVLNSLENRGGQENPVPWLIEKTAIALGEAARLVDLANEPDTNAWYREALKAPALPMIARLAPVVAVLCDRPETANEPRRWEPIAKGGTPALRAWIAQHDLERDIGDCVSSVGPSLSTPYAIAHDRAERIEKPPIPSDVANRASIQARLLSNCAAWLFRHNPAPTAQRLLLWIMGRLEGGEFVDIVTLSRKLLASDIDATSAETGEAYRALSEAGVLERADYLPSPGNPDCFRARVALLGDNESKYPREFQAEAFGPGRKDGWHPSWQEG
ncbi:MAG TPA: hypothetical protein VJV79_14560 [Polyangiaceae bacterium]|nr:hypothetical protein [Polyangiaceae bacterium]